MLLHVVLLSLAAAGTQAFSLHWRGLPARKFALAPLALPNRAVVPNSNFAPPQTLAIWDQHSQTPYNPNFTPKRDKTIAWDGQDGMCLEASGGKNGDAIRINRCTGGPAQVWNVLSHGDLDGEKDHIQLQLDGTNKCIAVDDRKGQLNGAPAELQECDNIVTESWVFNQSFKVKEPSRSRYNVSTPFAGFAILVLAFMSFSAWLWRKQQLRSVGMQQRSAFQSPVGESISLRELAPAALVVRPLPDGEQSLVMKAAARPLVHQGATLNPSQSRLGVARASAVVADPPRFQVQAVPVMSGSSGVSDKPGVSDKTSLYRRVYQEAMSDGWFSLRDSYQKLGEGKHGEVWKVDIRDGSGTFALKLTDIEDKRGRMIAKGENRAFRANQDLHAKAEELATRSVTEDFVTDWKRAASKLVQYFYLDEDNVSSPPYHYVVMEYVEGESLEKFEGTLTDAQKISVMLQIAEVISLMSSFECGHRRSWVHRDIKPGNVMIKINEDDTVDVKIIDLGLIANRKSRKFRNEYYGFDHCSWVPPEQKNSHTQFESCIVGFEPCDAGTKEMKSASAFDMYSLGILMIQICCGMDNHLPVTAPEKADENMQQCVKDFFATDLGKIVRPLTDPEPCDRPRPHAVLTELHALSDKVQACNARQVLESSREVDVTETGASVTETGGDEDDQKIIQT